MSTIANHATNALSYFAQQREDIKVLGTKAKDGDTEAVARCAFAFVSQLIVSMASTAILYVCLSTFVWGWLAGFIALLVGAFIGFQAAHYAAGSGYDLAVGGCASVYAFFKKPKAAAV